MEEGSNIGGVGCGVRIVDDYVVKAGGDAFQTFDDLVNHLDKSVGGGAAEAGLSLATGVLSWRACTLMAERDEGSSGKGRQGWKLALAPMEKGEIPRRSPASSSVEPERGMVGCPSGTKIDVSEREFSRGSVFTK